MWRDCTWLNEPRRWSIDGTRLRATTDADTDFWRETHYRYVHDSGHFYGRPASGDFTAVLRVRGDYRALYDQAGLMVRLNAAHWMKVGIELWEGRAVFGSVLTDERSDWAVGPAAERAEDFQLRASVQLGALTVEASTDGATWSLLRLAPFPAGASCLVGPMCCSPSRAGLDVVFDEFTVT